MSKDLTELDPDNEKEEKETETEKIEKETNDEEAEEIANIKKAQEQLTDKTSSNTIHSSDGLDELDKLIDSSVAANEDKPDDNLSVFIGNLHFASTEDDLRSVFEECGKIKKITIKKNKQLKPKGMAYIEFEEKDAQEIALSKNDTPVHNRKIKVLPKRSNIPGKKKRFQPYRKTKDPLTMLVEKIVSTTRKRR